MSSVTIAQLKERNIPVIVANHEGNVVEINSPFEHAFGWSPQDIVDQSLSVILPDVFKDSHNLGFARFSATGKSKILNHPLELKVVTKAGQEIESEHFIIAEKQNGQWLFAATLKPLSK